MPNLIPADLVCRGCTFAPFCLMEQENLSQGKQINPIVKRHRTLKQKEILFLSKSKFQNLYVIQHGALKTYHTEADGKELIRGFYFAGDVLGYKAIYTGHYVSSALALTETAICEIPYMHFLEFLHTRPTLQKHILYLISQRLNEGSYLGSTTAQQRLAAFLLDLSGRLHVSQAKLEFVLPMSRQDIGNYLRLTAETVSRLFSQMQKNEIIFIDHKKIRFLQLERLKQIAEGLDVCEY